MRVISVKKLKAFWEEPRHPNAESPLRTWYHTVKAADWTCFADVRGTYRTADLVGNKVVFDLGGNKYRLIAVIDYEAHKVFVRHVLGHKDYDRGQWKGDTFGEDWKPRPPAGAEGPEGGAGHGAEGKKPRRRRGKKK